MMPKFYQVCFSRLGGSDASSGWQSLNASKDIPLQIKEMYERTERGNQPAQHDTPRDLAGNPLCMLEILCDGSNVGISRVQYGLADTVGRENMFCHGFLLPNAYTLLKDPNTLLQISNENFHFSEKETAQIPADLQKDNAFTIESALKGCHMEGPFYATYISALYYALSTNTKNTIFVKTDGSDYMARALLYLAYCAVPYSLRVKITAATYASSNAQNVMLIFTPKLPESCMYIDPVSGENNILTDGLKNRWKRYPFVRYYADHYQELDKAGNKWFNNIEKYLANMGDQNLRDMDSLRLAFSMTENNTEASSSPAMLLYDWMALPVPNNRALESTITDLLRQVIQLNLNLGESGEQLLNQRLNTASSAQLQEAGCQYWVNRLNQTGQDEAYVILEALEANKQIYNPLCTSLMNDRQGKPLLTSYYRKKLTTLASIPDLTYDKLHTASLQFLESPAKMMPEFWQDIARIITNLGKSEFQKGQSCTVVLDHCNQFFFSIDPDEKLILNEWRCLTHNQIILEYDKIFREAFDPHRLEEYQSFYGHNRFEKFGTLYPSLVYSSDLLEKFLALKEGKYLEVERYVENGCSFQGWEYKSEQEVHVVINNLTDYALHYCNAVDHCKSFSFWDTLANATEKNIFTFMAKNHIPLFCNSEEFARDLVEDDFWLDSDNFAYAYEEYCRYTEKYPNDPYKKSGELLKKEKKRRDDELKQRQKEEKRQATQLEKQNSNKRGLFSFGKKQPEEDWNSEEFFPQDNSFNNDIQDIFSASHNSSFPSTDWEDISSTQDKAASHKGLGSKKSAGKHAAKKSENQKGKGERHGLPWKRS